jgi:hypothetical protein
MLDTKRRVIGQIIVCQGCCCGATHKDRPEVPVAWLKDEWRRRGLLKRVQLRGAGVWAPAIPTLGGAIHGCYNPPVGNQGRQHES